MNSNNEQKGLAELKCKEIINMSLEDFKSFIKTSKITLGVSTSLRKFLNITYEQLIVLLGKLHQLVSDIDNRGDSDKNKAEKEKALKTIEDITNLLFNLEIKCCYLVEYEGSLKLDI